MLLCKSLLNPFPVVRTRRTAADGSTPNSDKQRSGTSLRSNTASSAVDQPPRRVSPPPILIPGRSDSLPSNAPSLAVPETTAPSKVDGTPIGSPNTAGPSPLSQFPLPPGAVSGFRGDGERHGSRPSADLNGAPLNVPASLGVPGQRANALSRESRVELPDEARRYIANMVDSPNPQANAAGFEPPRMHVEERGAITARPENAVNGTWRETQDTITRTGQQRNGAQAERDAEFLDLDDDETSPTAASGRESTATPDSHVSVSAPSGDASMAATGSQAPRRKTSLLRKKPTLDAPPRGDSASNPASNTPQPSGSEPPSGFTSTVPSAQTSRTDLPQYSDSEYGTTAVDDKSTTAESVGSLQPSFRELPLLPTDLPHTQIIVTTSSIKPNDKGKDVLSFVIAVEPGAGKTGWRIEKLYSDVLGLDHRVRSTVGKTAGKKIATLPEGKLWRDHAPSRVDQRKVRTLYSNDYRAFFSC